MTSTETLRAYDAFRAHEKDIDRHTRSLRSKLALMTDERLEAWLSAIANQARDVSLDPAARMSLIVGTIGMLAKDAAAHEVTARV